MEKEEYEAQIKALKEEIELLKKKQTYEIKRQKYGLNWIDVPEAFEKDSENKIPVLEEVKEKSIKYNDGKPTHILIEGDNYHALQCLNYTHKGKIDVIYIDPPYNLGKDFIYRDARFLDKYPDGTIISKDHPLRHSAWLSFMQKRLSLAKNLLSNKGVLFISIDDTEFAQLKLLCDEIFSSSLFLGSITWESKTKSQNTKSAFDKLQPKTEHILVYSKINHFNLYKKGEKEYPETDEKGPYRIYKIEVMNSSGIRGRNTMIFPILGINPPANKQWKWGIDTIEKYSKRNDLILIDNYPSLKIRPDDEKNDITEPFWGFIPKEIGTAETGKKELNSILYPKDPGFETVKPKELIEKLLYHASTEKSIILDFFAGSGTTLQATLVANNNYNGNRQCILIQNKEKTFEVKDGIEIAKEGYETTYSSGYKYISDITYERNRRVIQGYTNSKGEQIPGLGNSLKYYKTAFIGQNNCKNANDDDRTELAKKAGCLLSLGENTLDEICSTEYYQLFTGSKEATAVYFTDDYEKFDEFKEKVAELAPKFKKTFVYIFAWSSADDFAYEFEDIPNIQIKAIPLPILEIYKSIYNA